VKNAGQIKYAARRQFVVFALVTALILGGTLGASWWIVRSITGPLRGIIRELTAGAEQTTNSAGQVSAASYFLPTARAPKPPRSKKPARPWRRCPA
jgi:hypothetical protein